jgi:hypothetical protein
MSLFAVYLSGLKELLLFRGRLVSYQKCEVHVLRRLIRNGVRVDKLKVKDLMGTRDAGGNNSLLIRTN